MCELHAMMWVRIVKKVGCWAGDGLLLLLLLLLLLPLLLLLLLLLLFHCLSLFPFLSTISLAYADINIIHACCFFYSKN